MVFASCDPHTISGLSSSASSAKHLAALWLTVCAALKHPDSELSCLHLAAHQSLPAVHALGRWQPLSPVPSAASSLHADVTREDNMITCPNCRSTHENACGSRVFARASCPVCLETSEPVVALPCGHAVCEDCF